MKIDKLRFNNESWRVETSECNANDVDIVFVFGNSEAIKNNNHSKLLKKLYPNAQIVGTSTAGNILDDGLSESEVVATAISFDDAKVAVSSKVIDNVSGENDAKDLVAELEQEGLKHIFILANGLTIDSSKLVKGLNSDSDIPITGGIAADGLKFEDTYVFCNEIDSENLAIAIGFYGENIHVKVGCQAGWEEFGASRVVTKSVGNVVYEIDNKPAIELYERYLGEYIKDLPSSGLLFPLSVKSDIHDKHEVIRVMMAINEDKSIVFVGDVPQGSQVRLMKTNIDNLIDGAALVAQNIEPHNEKRSLSLVVSCIGRRNVLKQLVDEEISVVQDILTKKSQVVGFYSYGEIAPFSDDLLNCKLHNQTMTITTIYED